MLIAAIRAPIATLLGAALVGTVLMCAGIVAASDDPGDQPPKRVAKIALARVPTDREAIQVQVKVGPLPEGARLVVRSEDGESLGTIAPYGAAARQKGGTYTVAVPKQGLSTADAKLALSFELKEKDGTVRAPTKNELKEATAVIIPVTDR